MVSSGGETAAAPEEGAGVVPVVAIAATSDFVTHSTATGVLLSRNSRMGDVAAAAADTEGTTGGVGQLKGSSFPWRGATNTRNC